MNPSRALALLPVAALTVCTLAISARGQEIDTPIITVKPSQSSESKPLKARFEVLHMLPNSIQVRSLANGLEIHTFAYSDQIRANMQKVFDQGGYQYGDKVEIWYQPGTEVALKIKGAPSKPL
jgi:hypothetical protein